MNIAHKKLGELCHIQSGGTPRRGVAGFYGGKIPWVKIADMDVQDGIVLKTEEYITTTGLEALGDRLFPKGTTLLAMYGSVGKVAVAGIPLATNQAILGIQIKNGNALDGGYLRWWLQSIQASLVHGARGVTQKNISATIVRDLDTPLPSLAEQRRIAAILDKADAIRRKRQEQIREAEGLLSSIFLDMFGDPVLNPKKWPEVTVGDIVSDVRDGPHVSPEYAESGIPFLSTRNVRPGQLVLEDMKYVSDHGYKILTKKFQPRQGDVLLTKGGTTGYAKEVDFAWSFAIWVHIAVLRPKNIVRPTFLEAALNSPNCYAQSQKFTHGIANRDLGLTRIRKIALSLPPLALQDEYCKRRRILQSGLIKIREGAREAGSLFDSLAQGLLKTHSEP